MFVKHEFMTKDTKTPNFNYCAVFVHILILRQLCSRSSEKSIQLTFDINSFSLFDLETPE